jgi:hypothetical protein
MQTSRALPRGAVLITLGALALLLAQAAVDLLGASLRLDAPALPRARASAEPTWRTDRDAGGCALLARNVFDARGPIPCDAPPPPPARPELDAEPGATCEGPMRLVATYVRRGDGTRSIAAVVDASGSARIVVEGMALGERVVASVASERVVLREDGGAACLLTLFARRERVVAIEAPPATTTPLPGVRVLGDRIEVDRSAIDRAVADPSSALGRLRAIPQADGVRLFGIRRDHPLAIAGVENGDVLRALDGRPMADPDAWLEALTIVRTPGLHSIELDRRGARTALSLSVIDR